MIVRRIAPVLLGVAAFVAVIYLASGGALPRSRSAALATPTPGHGQASPTSRPGASAPSSARSMPSTPDGPLVFTYFFYWYDATTGQHMSPLRDHPIPNPVPSWHNPAWYQKELTDMRSAGIDVVLPVYWGFGTEAWSTEGLKYLVGARDQLAASGGAPAVGMFYDTTILGSRDLNQPAGQAFFYANIKDFFQRIPARMWARVSGRPVIWLFRPPVGTTFSQAVFNQASASFLRDFGIRPYIVREVTWDCSVTGWTGTTPTRDCSHPLTSDASYEWNVAYNGYWDKGTVAAVGPGYDDTLIPGRSGSVRPRAGGQWYQMNFEKAVVSRRQLLVIETWNEFHEGSDVAESVEYGRTYIDFTRAGISAYRSYFAAHR